MRVKAIVLQEAGLDGFWIYRLLIAKGIESHVVDAASIAFPRRHRPAKTDAIDGETLCATSMPPHAGQCGLGERVEVKHEADDGGGGVFVAVELWCIHQIALIARLHMGTVGSRAFVDGAKSFRSVVSVSMV